MNSTPSYNYRRWVTFGSLTLLPLLGMGLTGCVMQKTRHCIPTPAELAKADAGTHDVQRVYTDMLGDIYPTPQKEVEAGEFGKTYGEFFKVADVDYKLNPTLYVMWPGYNAQTEREKLGARLKVWQSNGNYKRFCVLVHGYNNSTTTAKSSYAHVIERIKELMPDKGIGFVEFYWDGLTAEQGSLIQKTVGCVNTWGPAERNSYFAGQNGLRSVLQLLNPEADSSKWKDILIVSHSRGASVVLSALAKPSFMYNTMEGRGGILNEINGVCAAKKGYEPKLLLSDFACSSAPLDNSKITAYLLAPAVGTYDFMPEGADTKNDVKLWDSNHLIDFRKANIVLGPNDEDHVLYKVIRKLDLAGLFGSTLVGSDPNLAYCLTSDLTFKGSANAHVRDFSKRADGARGHDFQLYIYSDEFKDMLTYYFNK